MIFREKDLFEELERVTLSVNVEYVILAIAYMKFIIVLVFFILRVTTEIKGNVMRCYGFGIPILCRLN